MADRDAMGWKRCSIDRLPLNLIIKLAKLMGRSMLTLDFSNFQIFGARRQPIDRQIAIF
jgi:hypothetical protein